MELKSPEELRYYEVLYHGLLDKFFNVHDASRIYNFIELMAVTFNVNPSVLTQATAAIMKNENNFAPQITEQIVLMGKFSNLSKREQARALGISPTKYYRAIEAFEADPFPINPKLKIDQSVEITKAMHQYRRVAKLMV